MTSPYTPKDMSVERRSGHETGQQQEETPQGGQEYAERFGMLIEDPDESEAAELPSQEEEAPEMSAEAKERLDHAEDLLGRLEDRLNEKERLLREGALDNLTQDEPKTGIEFAVTFNLQAAIDKAKRAGADTASLKEKREELMRRIAELKIEFSEE